MISEKTIDAVQEAITLQQLRGATTLVASIQPGLIEGALNAFPGYRKIFVPQIAGGTETSRVEATREQLRARVGEHAILLFVECQTAEEFREALGKLPMRTSAEWRSFGEFSV